MVRLVFSGHFFNPVGYFLKIRSFYQGERLSSFCMVIWKLCWTRLAWPFSRSLPKVWNLFYRGHLIWYVGELVLSLGLNFVKCFSIWNVLDLFNRFHSCWVFYNLYIGIIIWFQHLIGWGILRFGTLLMLHQYWNQLYYLKFNKGTVLRCYNSRLYLWSDECIFKVGVHILDRSGSYVHLKAR